ncbi:MAG TPA: Mur ligase family protein [Candidatus Acidoferrales bacterium]|nr:Mur ligase family protein [Candidatus Acidoferrales bacterium]
MDFDTAVKLLDRSIGESVSARFPGRLDRMRTLLAKLGNPERDFRSIHVGGTAGKGSTATMCAAILRASGLHVGLHTKPHLHSVVERAKIDGVPIGEERFAAIFEQLAPIIEEMRGGEWGPPSYFELLVALSFVYFAQENVDVAVVEVGVGGALDGTNLIQPLISVITNVGTDHKDVLGDTIEQIARDKAGIIKSGIPVVTAAQDAAALAVIEAAASARGSALTVLDKDANVLSRLGDLPYAQQVDVTTSNGAYSFVLPLIGEFQATNAATAILTCEQVRETLPTNPADVARGLRDISLPGRAEYYPAHPSLLFDVAHNVEKAAALRAAIARHFPTKRCVFVVAIAQEKDAAGMFAAWHGLPAQFIFTTFDVSHRRSRHSRTLVNAAEHAGLPSRAVDDPLEALAIARRIAGANDMVVVTGSTFLVGTLRKWFLENSLVPGTVHV